MFSIYNLSICKCLEFLNLPEAKALHWCLIIKRNLIRTAYVAFDFVWNVLYYVENDIQIIYTTIFQVVCLFKQLPLLFNNVIIERKAFRIFMCIYLYCMYI